MADPDTPPPGYPVKLWFVGSGGRLVSCWARERPRSFLLQEREPITHIKVVELRDAHTTPRAAVEAFTERRRRMATRLADAAREMRADADAAEKALEDHYG